VLAQVGPVVIAPHLEGDLERLLQALEAFAHRREGHAQTQVLPLEPGGADAQPGASAGEDIQGGDLLHQDAGMAIGHACHQRAEPGARCVAGYEREGGVGLEHVQLYRPDGRDLEEVVHDPDGAVADVVRRASDLGQPRAEIGRSAGPGEVGDLQA
jgi:hypothetical protein